MDKQSNAQQLGQQQSYSVKVGDKYYSFNRLDPMGMFLGLSADFQKIAGHVGEEQSSKLATAAVLSLSRNILSKTYLSGLVDAIDTISQNSPGKWQRFANRYAASLVPAGVGQVRVKWTPR
jgi:hypothetical protein